MNSANLLADILTEAGMQSEVKYNFIEKIGIVQVDVSDIIKKMNN